MYNDTLKENYIKEKESSKSIEKYLYLIFNKTSRIEEELNKDLYKFTKDNIKDLYKSLNMGSFDSLYVMNSELVQYTKWCLKKHLETVKNNQFITFDKEMLAECINIEKVNKKIISKQNLLRIIEGFPNPSDQFALLALFEGLKGTDFCEIINSKVEDIKNNMISLCTRRTIEISDLLIEYAKEAQEEYKYYAITGDMVDRNFALRGDGIIKDMYNSSDGVTEFQKGRRLYTKVKRALRTTGYDMMTPNDLAISGQINMIQEGARDEGVGRKQWLKEHISEVSEQYGTRIVYSTFIVKFSEYLD